MRQRQPTWFYRQLFSYLPMFLIISSLLILVALQLLGEQSKKSAMEANNMVAEQIVQLTDHSLRSVDEQIVREILNNRQLLSFYQTAKPEPLFIYEVAKVLQDIVNGVNMVHSVYLYDTRNRLVLTQMQTLSVEDFADKDFLLEHAKLSRPFTWTGLRAYSEHRSQTEPDEVVSFVRRVPVPNGYYGMMVVNVRGDKINELLQRFSPAGHTFIRLYDSTGRWMAGTSELEGEQQRTDREWSEVKSDYSGWTVRTGVAGSRWYGVLGGFSLALLALAAIAVLLGVMWIIYQTRVSSRPIEAIISRLDRSGSKSGRSFDLSKPPEELNLIESAVVDLMERSQFYEDRHKEDLIYRRKSLFREAVSGENRWSEEEFRNHLGELGLPRSFSHICTVVVELDRYSAFEQRYSLKDRYLFKFALRSAVKEIALERRLPVWEEWTAASQLSLLYLMQAEEGETPDVITAASNQLIEWVQTHLPFTVTAAVGAAVDRHSLLPLALEETGEILHYKSVVGSSRTIGYRDVQRRKDASDVTLQHLHGIRQTIAAFKAGDPAWDGLFLCFFAKVKEVMATRDDLTAMSHFFVYSLHKEVMDLPAVYREYWNEHVLVRLTDAVQTFDTVEDLQQRMLEGLRVYEKQLAVLKQKGNPGLIPDIKAYINLHYRNHELSLNHLSDEFNISTTYFSRLFKEETGETFVSYLTQVRLEQARKLLLETEEPVQDIANRIGYLHAFSFIRVFKKTYGLTPGDYRKHTTIQAQNSGSDG